LMDGPDRTDTPISAILITGMSAVGTKQTSACALHMSAFDPKRTLAVHCGNGF
jgi:hypothetical protein